MKILLIAGGWSSEREVSLTGARGMQEALLKRGHAVTFFDLLENFDELLETARQHDFALINLHGSPGEDGLVQAMLEKAGIAAVMANGMPHIQTLADLVSANDCDHDGVAELFERLGL